MAGDTTTILVVQHDPDAGPGLIGDRLALSGCRPVRCGPDGVAPDAIAIPGSLEGVDGVVVLGGRSGPLDDGAAPWLPLVRALIASALAEGTPLLAVCLGAQLLATVAGGEVAALADGPEIGVHPLWTTEAAFGDPLFGGLEPPLQALQWHSLEVVRLPPGSRLLVHGERCVNQAFRVGRVAWGVQFHLEALSQSIAAWARSEAGRADVDEAGLSGADLLADARVAEAGLRGLWAPVADRWIALCREHRTERTSA